MQSMCFSFSFHHLGTGTTLISMLGQLHHAHALVMHGWQMDSRTHRPVETFVTVPVLNPKTQQVAQYSS